MADSKTNGEQTRSYKRRRCDPVSSPGFSTSSPLPTKVNKKQMLLGEQTGTTVDQKDKIVKDVHKDGIRLCRSSECHLRATFRKIGKQTEFCFGHASGKEGYVKIRGLCQVGDCSTYASFGQEGGHCPIWCKDHIPREQKYERVVSTVTCLYEGCRTRPSYGHEGESPQYCEKHGKSLGMTSQKKKTCQEPGCRKTPSFGKDYDSYPEFCKTHAPDAYVNVWVKRCQYIPMPPELKCLHAANYAPPGSRSVTNAQFCKVHRPSTDWLYVGNKLCEGKNDDWILCTRPALYGFLFEPKTTCGAHRLPNQWRNNKPRCEIPKCKERPVYTDQCENYPRRCELHHEEGDLDVIQRECKSCNLTWFIRSGLDICEDCRIVTSVKRKRIHEERIAIVLKEAGIKFIHDKTVDTVCSTRRPDFVLAPIHLENNHIVILEIDEDQHSTYLCSCEHSRMIELFQSFGGCRVTFIRFNPFPFKYLDEKDNPCVTLRGARESRLLNVIRNLQENPPVEPLTAVYLFYNGDDGVNRLTTLDYEAHQVTERKMKDTLEFRKLIIAQAESQMSNGDAQAIESKERKRPDQVTTEFEEKESKLEAIMPQMKCSTCKEEKPLLDFPLADLPPKGIDYTCITCKRLLDQQNREKSKS